MSVGPNEIFEQTLIYCSWEGGGREGGGRGGVELVLNKEFGEWDSAVISKHLFHYNCF